MLVNVAGVNYEGGFYDQAYQRIQSIIRLNIEATLAVTHAAFQYRNPQQIFTNSSTESFHPQFSKNGGTTCLRSAIPVRQSLNTSWKKS